MTQPTATIRPYCTEDEKLVRFVVGKANMGLLASANQRVYTNPISIAIWLGLSAIFIQVMKWWPAGDFGFWEYLKPLPALASMAVPLLFLVDWVNRPDFEKYTQDVLKYADLRDLDAYYSKSPASGLWIIEYGETFIGLISISSTDSGLPGFTAEGPKPRTSTIRHFHVEEIYRGSEVQDDLLKHALEHVFSNDPSVDRVQIVDYGVLSPYIQTALRKAGFQHDHDVGDIGILHWKVTLRVLNRKLWQKRPSL